jgi:hypothetical protein
MKNAVFWDLHGATSQKTAFFNDSNNAKNDESKDGDLMGNNGWCEYLNT